MSMFTKAKKSQAKLRMAIEGPSGSGKTYTALSIAKGLGARVALIDTEHASASKYAGLFDFDTCSLREFHPQKYIDAIKAAGNEGYDVIIVDSLSHGWSGPGGAMELRDQAEARSKSRNGFTAWADVTPIQNALIQSILSSPAHVICTMRVKTEWVIEDVNGKKAPRKLGLKPDQRPGVEYEFDIVADLDEAKMVVAKSRMPELAKAVINEPGEELGQRLKAWLSDGEPAQVERPSSPAIGFGRFKGQGFRPEFIEGLREDVMTAEAKLQAEPEAKWAPSIRANLDALAPYLSVTGS
jgi:hypothetical protein